MAYLLFLAEPGRIPAAMLWQAYQRAEQELFVGLRSSQAFLERYLLENGVTPGFGDMFSKYLSQFTGFRQKANEVASLITKVWEDRQFLSLREQAVTLMVSSYLTDDVQPVLVAYLLKKLQNHQAEADLVNFTQELTRRKEKP